MRKWCVVDGEGDSGTTGLLGAAIYSDRLHAYLTDHQAIRDALYEHAARGYTFVCHNAQYDLPVVWWQLGLHATAEYYNHAFTVGKYHYKPKRPPAQIWDSLNLSGGLSVASLGTALGLPKLQTPAVLTGGHPDPDSWRCPSHDIIECVDCYAVRDAEIVHRYMEDYAAVLAGWSVPPHRRIAGAAAEVWKALDRPEPVKIADPRIRELSRHSYFGGRVETFKLGHFSPLYTADVVSMYPSVMLATPLPDPGCMHYMVRPVTTGYPLHLEGVAECTLRVPHSYIPPLPHRQRGSRVFATGLQRGTWTHLELRHALQCGTEVLTIHRGAWSDRSLYPFGTFIATLWEARQAYRKAKDPRQQVVKVLLNSAYGRLGMDGNPLVQQEMPYPLHWPLEKQIGLQAFEIGDMIFARRRVTHPLDGQWQNVLWASHITAAARVKLHGLLLQQGSSVVYCDTDSIFSMSPIVGTGEGLGALQSEGTYMDSWIVGPKLYALLPLLYDRPQTWGTTPCDKHGRVACEDCAWLYKAKGVPRKLAADFLAGREVIFGSPIKPASQKPGGPMAGTWIEIHRQRGLTPHRRTPLDASVVDLEAGWTDTIPPAYCMAYRATSAQYGALWRELAGYWSL